MFGYIRNHPYIISFVVLVLILFFIFFIPLEFSFGESLFGAVSLSAIGVGGYWWKEVGLG